jgi:hypothetical protein
MSDNTKGPQVSARTLLIAAVLVLVGSTGLATATGGTAFADDDTSAHHSHDYFDQGRCDDSAEILSMDEQLECRGTY